MSNNFIVHPGIVIQNYINTYEMPLEKTLSALNISKKDLSNIYSAKTLLSEDAIEGLNILFPEIPSTYWRNYQSKYIEYIDSINQEENYFTETELKALAKRFNFKKVFKGLDWDLNRQAQEMLSILKIPHFSAFEEKYGGLDVKFMEDGGLQEAIAIWLNLAEEEIEIQNKELSSIEYNRENLINNLLKIKRISLNEDTKDAVSSLRKALNRLGIYLVLEPALENSKVRGALTSYENKPAIYLTGRFKTHDHLWFAFAHELGHLILHYNEAQNAPLITLEDDPDETVIENEANEFARNFLIDSDSYQDFVKTNIFTEKTIRTFATQQHILPGIVVARLQHDKKIPYSEFHYLKSSFSF